MVTIKIVKKNPRIKIGRPQKWRWRAEAVNGQVLATSAEAYTNREDCIDAAVLLFADATIDPALKNSVKLQEVFLEDETGYSAALRLNPVSSK